ncbi:hypothetical protein ID550_27015, partial [Klebsiella pneumoniae]|nr:hypothetical protein [Klebsiella pneumoniae]
RGAVRCLRRRYPEEPRRGGTGHRAERLGLGIAAEPVRAPFVGGLVARLSEPGQVRGAWPSQLGYAWGGERVVLDAFAVPERLLNVPLTLQVLRDGRYRVFDGGVTVLEGQVGQPASADGVEISVARIDARPG